VEPTKVERRGCGTVGDLGICDEKFIAPLREIASFISRMAQLPASDRTYRPQGQRQAALRRRRHGVRGRSQRRHTRAAACGGEFEDQTAGMPRTVSPT
jgi:hypothetical protein